MNLILLAKIIHITSAIFFIGCVNFRTNIMPRVKPTIGTEAFEVLENALNKPTRAFGIINNALLFISGTYLFSQYYTPSNTLLLVKALLGLLVILFFYSAPFYMPKLVCQNPKLKTKIHYILLTVMLIIVICSQWMFY